MREDVVDGVPRCIARSQREAISSAFVPCGRAARARLQLVRALADAQHVISGVGGSSVYAVAAQGIARASARTTDAATRAAAGPDVASAVDLRLADVQLAACVKAMRTADEMTGTLVDALV